MRNDPPPGVLLWRCRRGMKELDLVLEGWVRHHYEGASSTERALFAQILELPDPELADFVLGGRVAGDPGLAAVLAQLAAP